MSIWGAKTRLCGKWKLEEFLVNGTDRTKVYFPQHLYFEYYYRSGKYEYINGGTSQSETGNWSFADDKMKVIRTADSNFVADEVTILKLKNHAYWYSYTIADSVYEMHMLGNN